MQKIKVQVKNKKLMKLTSKLIQRKALLIAFDLQLLT